MASFLLAKMCCSAVPSTVSFEYVKSRDVGERILNLERCTRSKVWRNQLTQNIQAKILLYSSLKYRVTCD